MTYIFSSLSPLYSAIPINVSAGDRLTFVTFFVFGKCHYVALSVSACARRLFRAYYYMSRIMVIRRREQRNVKSNNSFKKVLGQ